MPPMIELVKTLTVPIEERNVRAEHACLYHPVKHSELQQALRNCLHRVDSVGADAALHPPLESRQYRILVAEDNPVNQKLVLGILGKYDHEVTVVNNGLEAVRILDRCDFDIILMDVQMPELDGLEATQMIRKNRESSRSSVPILALTAHALSSDRQRCLEAGMNDYLSKPFKAADLLSKVDGLVSAAAHRRASVTPSAATNSKPIIEWSQALETVDGDRRLLGELIDIFLRERDGMISDLARSIAAVDPAATRRCAHSLKGTLQHLGAWQCAQIASSIETNCSATENENQAKYLKLKECLDDLTVELRRFQKTPTRGFGSQKSK